jgi:hypothetical protein
MASSRRSASADISPRFRWSAVTTASCRAVDFDLAMSSVSYSEAVFLP